jgi:hypothetical protein
MTSAAVRVGEELAAGLLARQAGRAREVNRG